MGMKPAPAALAALAVLAVLASAGGRALADKCGGDRECSCGDSVVRDYRLPGDLGPCPANGLEIGGAVEFDGGGHTIFGSRGKSFGLRLAAGASGSRVRNVKVTGFGRGLRLQDVRGARIENLEAYRNGDSREHEGYGIDVAKGAMDNLLSGVKVHHNADEGIHFGTRASGNRVIDSDVSSNYRENIYVLATDGTRIERSRLRSPGQGAANVYVKFARDTRLDGNRIDGGTVQIRGGSTGTVLSGNDLSNTNVVLQEQDDRRFGKGSPARTTIRGGRIEASGSCIRVEMASDVVIEDVDLRCRDAVTVAGGSDVALSGLANTSVRCDGRGRVTRRAPLDVRFVDSAGKPQPRVKIRSRSGTPLGEAGADGHYRGVVEVGRLECPRGDWKAVGEVEVDAEGRTKMVSIGSLRGNVTIPGTPSGKR
jgi:Right handed beta helix region